MELTCEPASGRPHNLHHSWQSQDHQPGQAAGIEVTYVPPVNHFVKLVTPNTLIRTGL